MLAYELNSIRDLTAYTYPGSPGIDPLLGCFASFHRFSHTFACLLRLWGLAMAADRVKSTWKHDLRLLDHHDAIALKKGGERGDITRDEHHISFVGLRDYFAYLCLNGYWYSCSEQYRINSFVRGKGYAVWFLGHGIAWPCQSQS